MTWPRIKKNVLIFKITFIRRIERCNIICIIKNDFNNMSQDYFPNVLHIQIQKQNHTFRLGADGPENDQDSSDLTCVLATCYLRFSNESD